ncbi:2-succinyl-5-enolpyruvyl-6-hydroxy-3-cyclohexene-1-carboxylic-acid synthase [Echinimonas agarilytica]|uniref:2-succinyl-5-enolpyruvyl-6-hydroxy-3-cyclohexene-1-carboxylate synthase n=1 Tax=Echinimonas agarilytica TaxID=1215918 RepID=A0AA42B8N9_9GAMM|nr:2-succinyl-5-enolpyruvyl-6-hydroxy-3-cyclohexene-1-carboxylic-acid synthase [Echinimonas agarilytica]MCM2681097.1 2-succinyl-5-enolpyruvyl-6-hydroxy-3-cyclohexene-1-carboxylic-acid synthase [Echinimonas agarilytica]
MTNFFPTQFSHCNELYAHVLIEELSRLGVQHICIAPGSRSTPLTLAAIAHPHIQTPTHFDERGLGFFALGICKSTQAPVAVIVTSGSAVANLYPAVVEAYQTQHPIILLTADRPEELVDCGANQAIEQPGIFSHFVRASLNLDAPDTHPSLSDMLAHLNIAVHQPIQGPIHVNCPYAEPLYPSQPKQSYAELLAPIKPWLNSHQSYHQSSEQSTLVDFDLPNLPGVIIAGALFPDEQDAALKLQQQLGWLLLADVQSNLRQHDHVLCFPELALAVPDLAEHLQHCQQFLMLGGRLTSKPLMQWLANKHWQHSCQISAHPGPFDAGLVIMRRVKCRVNQAVLHHSDPATSQPEFATTVNKAISHQLQTSQTAPLSELGVAYHLKKLVPQDSMLMLGNSLSIRLFEHAHQGPQQIVSSRGASGIDGLVATAAGLAYTQEKSRLTTLVLGDLSLLHDLNSLALLSKVSAPICVIVLNNDGGNIFDALPVPDVETLDDYYRLRHGYQFKDSAAQFGLNYFAPTCLEDLETSLQHALIKGGAHLIEIVTPAGEAMTQLKQSIANAQHITL